VKEPLASILLKPADERLENTSGAETTTNTISVKANQNPWLKDHFSVGDQQSRADRRDQIA
jgi:hypothetical protein